MRKNSNLQSVTRIIRERLRQASVAREEWLPGVRGLCKAGKFSPRTCRKALVKLASEGRCRVVPRRGILVLKGATAAEVAAPPSPLPPDVRPIRRWEEVRDRLSTDMLTGVYPPGSILPLCKVLADRYGSAHVQLQRAMRALEHEGRLVKERRRYKVFTPRRHSVTSATIVLIAHTPSLLDLIGFTPRAEENLHHLERLCILHDLRLEYLSFRDPILRTPRARQLMDSDAKANVLGYMLWTLGLIADDVHNLAQRLAATGKPVAVLDEMGRYSYPSLRPEDPLFQEEIGKYAYPEVMRRSPLFQVFGMAFSRMAGRDMGKFLFDRGHRHVAFFGAGTHEPCNLNRSDGIEEYLRDNGAGTLRRHWLSGMDSTLDGVGSPPPDVNVHVRQIQRYIDSLGMHYNSPQIIRIGQDSGALAEMTMWKGRDAGQLGEALAEPRTTAWVAGGDHIAYMLLDFLASRSVAIPRDLTVVSFDDAPGAFNAGLTTYNFNATAVVDAMMEHVLGRPSAMRTKKREVVEIPGYVVERRTSGPASSRGK
jgi:DNA-binding transcriptional regulator YhcF (GntR family)